MCAVDELAAEISHGELVTDPRLLARIASFLAMALEIPIL
jgi:hypothetical protein